MDTLITVINHIYSVFFPCYVEYETEIKYIELHLKKSASLSCEIYVPMFKRS